MQPMPFKRRGTTPVVGEPLPPIAAGFPERLRDARLRAGYLSQPQLARDMAINPNTISRHERDAHRPTLDMLFAYARFLRVSVDYLQHGLAMPRAVHAYLALPEADKLLPETRARLPQISWSQLTAGAVSIGQVRQVAEFVDKNLRESRQFADDPQAAREAARAHAELFDDDDEDDPAQQTSLPLPATAGR